MQITFHSAWISNNQYTTTDARMNIQHDDGTTGQYTCQANLPPELQTAIADYFVKIAQENLRVPPHNPATYEAKGEPL